MEIMRQTRKVMTFIFKNLKFKSPTIKQLVTSLINPIQVESRGGQ